MLMVTNPAGLCCFILLYTMTEKAKDIACVIAYLLFPGDKEVTIQP